MKEARPGNESRVVRRRGRRWPRWRESGHKLAVMREATYEQLSPDLGPGSLVVARRGATVLVEKR